MDLSAGRAGRAVVPSETTTGVSSSSNASGCTTKGSVNAGTQAKVSHHSGVSLPKQPAHGSRVQVRVETHTHASAHGRTRQVAAVSTAASHPPSHKASHAENTSKTLSKAPSKATSKAPSKAPSKAATVAECKAVSKMASDSPAESHDPRPASIRERIVVKEKIGGGSNGHADGGVLEARVEVSVHERQSSRSQSTAAIRSESASRGKGEGKSHRSSESAAKLSPSQPGSAKGGPHNAGPAPSKTPSQKAHDVVSVKTATAKAMAIHAASQVVPQEKETSVRARSVQAVSVKAGWAKGPTVKSSSHSVAAQTHKPRSVRDWITPPPPPKNMALVSLPIAMSGAIPPPPPPQSQHSAKSGKGASGPDAGTGSAVASAKVSVKAGSAVATCKDLVVSSSSVIKSASQGSNHSRSGAGGGGVKASATVKEPSKAGSVTKSASITMKSTGGKDVDGEKGGEKMDKGAPVMVSIEETWTRKVSFPVGEGEGIRVRMRKGSQGFVLGGK